MHTTHAEIQQFLQQQTSIPLLSGAVDDSLTKAGVVPFIRGTPMTFYVMKPLGRGYRDDDPGFQVCKGTRMYHSPQGWQDMRTADVHGEKESLVVTALREGIEELGLKLSNIRCLFDVGSYHFTSATTARPKKMWLFAAEIDDALDFPPAYATATTADRRWLSVEEFTALGRPDHRYILPDIERKLASAAL